MILHHEPLAQLRARQREIATSCSDTACYKGLLVEEGTGRTTKEDIVRKQHDKLHMILHHEPLAQLVEHLTFNQRVEGSSPSWLTILILRVWRNWQTR